MKEIVLCPNPFRDLGLKAAIQSAEILGEDGIQTKICLPFHVDGNANIPEKVPLHSLGGSLKTADMIVCFGGDGTILHVAKEASIHNVPVLGVNMGSVGFMAELECSELPLLRRIALGRYKTELRMMIDISIVRNGKRVYTNTALNDAVFTKGAVARIIDLSVYSDNALISSVCGDGIIVSTPTGSTAYSMSAGGPIVEPTAENMIVTPICAHALQAKAFVLSHNHEVKIKIGTLGRKTAYLSVDGSRAFKLCTEDEIFIKKSKHQTKLVRLTDKNFYEILKRKFNVQGEPV